MSRVLKGAYKGKDTKIIGLAYLDDDKGTSFIVRTLDFDVFIGRRTNDGLIDIKHIKQAFEYFDSLVGKAKMKCIDIEYEVEKESHVSIGMIFDMFRYSGDSVIKIRNKNSWVMLHHRHYEDEDHKRRIIEFFKGQILGRWGSFGCTTHVIRGLEE